MGSYVFPGNEGGNVAATKLSSSVSPKPLTIPVEESYGRSNNAHR